MKTIRRRGTKLLSLLLVVLLMLSSMGGALAAEPKWADGSYDGFAQGRNGPVEMRVTIAGGQITAIETVSQSETPDIWQNALGMIGKILSAQSVDVDVVSGATLSSNAIKGAVGGALDKAAAAAANGFSGGTGTSSDPYVISSAAGLAWFQGQVNAGNSYADQYIKLGQDIALSGQWTPVGSTSNPFAGSFDGQGHTISGLTIGSAESRSTEAYAGLFGYVLNTAVLRGIKLTNIAIYTDVSAASVAYGGALLAYAKVDSASGKGTVIDNCFASGVVDVRTANKSAMVGGLAGFTNQYGVLTNSGADVDVTVDTGSAILNAGGLLGYPSINTLTMNCYALGDVTVASSSTSANAGGLAGTIGGVFYNCYAAGGVVQNVSSNVRVGGLAGNIVTAGIVMSSYYDNALDTAVKNVSGKVDESVLGKSAAALASAEFISLLGSNLSPTAQSTASAKVEAFCGTSLKDTMSQLIAVVNGEFFDWGLANGKAVLTGALWVPSETDDSIFDGGNGTEGDPYQIATEAQLRAFALSLNDKINYTGKHIKLTDNIALTSAWTPVGVGEYAFSGTFDGDGKTISSIVIGTAEAPLQDTGNGVYYGLFGVLDGAVVRNLKLEADIYVVSNSSCYVGGLAGYCANSLIDGVSVSGTMWGKTTHDKANIFVGGAIGMQYKGQLVNSMGSAAVRAEAVGGIAEAGGLVGLNNRALTANCLATGDVSGTAKRGTENGVEYEGMAAAGGITGVHAGNMVNCYATGDTSSDTFSYYVGALAGWVTGIGNLYDSYFSTESSQTIAEQTVNPVVAAGWLVGPGISDEGEPYSGSISYQIEGLTESALASGDFASKLNGNFSVFPINLAADYPGVTLRGWMFTDATVLPTGEAAAVTYVEPDIELPVVQPNYVDGVYYGRSTDGMLIVKLTVHEGKIVAVDAGADYASSVAVIISAQGTDTLDTTTATMQRLKSSADIALQKAKVGDITGYGKADPTIFAGGSGTQASPYRISTETQLRAFAAAVNTDEDFAGKVIELTADVVLTQEWIPAGGPAPHPFSGSFDGNGHTISGLTIGSAVEPALYQYAGLFAYIENGTVTDLVLRNVDISTANDGSSRIYAGALTGFVDQTIYANGSAVGSSGYIDNVTVAGKLSVASNSGAAYVAGLAASVIRGTITNCAVDVNITASSKAAWAYAGGLTGIVARAGIINNRISGSIVSSASLNKTAIGGLSGFHSAVSYNNFADIELISTGSTGDVGALAGRNTGIGLMLPGYYNTGRTQKAGDTEFPGLSVGTIVVGEQDGKGAVRDLIGKTAAQINAGDVTTLLNTGIADTATLAQATALLANNWKVSLPSGLKLFSWKLAGGTAVLDAAADTGISDPGGYYGGGSTGIANPSSAITVTTNNNKATAAQSFTAITGSDGVAAASVSKDQIGALVKAAREIAQEHKSQAAVEINIDTGSGAKGMSVTIPQAAVSSLTDGVNALTISSSVATVTFNGAALTEIGKKTAGDITITAQKPGATALSDQGKAVIGSRPVYDLKITSGGTTISSFGGGTATVSVPYTHIEGEDASKIVVYYISGSGELIMVPDCVYDASTGIVTFKTSHFSSYAVGYNNVSFTDVSGWFSDYVNYLGARGIINGTGGWKFSPDANITRAEFVTILANLSGADLSVYTSSAFSDVSVNDWYFASVRWAYENGVAAGSNGKFDPNAFITRQDAAVMVARYAEKVAGYTLPETTSAVTFTDSAEISSYASDAVTAMQQAGIISGGSDGSFAPRANATRAQAAKMVAVFLQDMITN
ncbi:S-layer homology domain-containing protein [Sporobacter termitidis DSM 10068]|uniref:S-layer homology domain-containing protein n=1 Tax=Sporobacter termitidis DSM 10068 TaxID=1123282 RepID=A0A1M5Z3P3_9FIRM|nr:S-layer homology domain-containing protein [Sporobacter termitidis]SHI18744.1 S-layer homology domain-containing protein [Sporobacter termitidis DSM 10068]